VEYSLHYIQNAYPKTTFMEQQGSLFDLHLDQQSVNYLSETARWSRLLSIVGFICCGLMAVVGLFLGTTMSRMVSEAGGGTTESGMLGVSSGIRSFFLILSAIILFFPAYYLFNFSTKMRRALRNNDQFVLAVSLKNLKSFFKFCGILVIIMLSFYTLALISAIIGAMVGHRP
jgi:uncharacterized membrane protein